MKTLTAAIILLGLGSAASLLADTPSNTPSNPPSCCGSGCEAHDHAKAAKSCPASQASKSGPGAAEEGVHADAHPEWAPSHREVRP